MCVLMEKRREASINNSWHQHKHIMSAVHEPWDYFDYIYCLTLADTPDRHLPLRQALSRVGLGGRAKVVMNERDRESGKRGCYNAHRDAIADARDKGARNALIMEDDVDFSDDWEQWLQKGVEFMSTNPDTWDVFLLGWVPFRSRRSRLHKNVSEVRCGFNMHAYVVNKRALQRRLPEYARPVDVELLCPFYDETRGPVGQKCSGRNPKYRVYALRPMIAFQRFDGTSSTMDTGSATDGTKRAGNQRLIRLLGVTSDYIYTPTLVVTFGVVAVLAVLATLSMITVMSVSVVRAQRR